MRDELQLLTEDQHATDVNSTEQSPAAPQSIASIAAVIAPALALAACGGGDGRSLSVEPAAPPIKGVDNAKVALAMAYGANSQYFSTWVVANSLQPFG